MPEWSNSKANSIGVWTGAVWLVLLSAAPASFATLANWANETRTGVLLMRPDAGGPLSPAMLLATDVDIEVSGPVARVVVRQRFLNPSQHFGEAFYVFPLPETAAVHGMEMVVGYRRVIGEIREKADARREYETARQEGRRASLVEQMRPNLFTASVANVAGGEQVEVTLRYSQTVTMNGSRFDLRFPLTLTPRYVPGSDYDHPLDVPVPVTAVLHPAGGAAAGERPASDAIPTARVAVTVDAGYRLATVQSSSHAIRHRDTGVAYEVSLVPDTVAMDRDFHLFWELADAGASRAGFFSEVVAGEHYGLLLLTPPAKAGSARLPREVIFVIDTSGSMGGASMEQARQALAAALSRLDPQDRFNVIEFDSSFNVLFDRPVAAHAHRVDEAVNFVMALQAGGGTEMLPALRAALDMPHDGERLRQVVFITDGAVGNEHAVFALLHQRLGGARLFTVGIGSAPNGYLMRKAAEVGGGTFTYVGASAQVQERISELLRRLESPVLRNITVELPPGVEAELWPARVPDLYEGEPVLVAMKLNQVPGSFTVSGRADVPWERVVPVSAVGGHAGVGKVWARRRIEALMDRIIRGEPEAVVRQEVVRTALAHELMSRYTSFVAVDTTPVRQANEPLVPGVVPNAAPHGFEYPPTALGLERLWLYGLLCLLAAAVTGGTWRWRGRG